MSTSTTDPEFYQAPKYTPEPIPASAPARLLFLRLHHRQHSHRDGDRADRSRHILRVTASSRKRSSSTRPRLLVISPRSTCPPTERESVKKRVEEFRKAVKQGKAVEPLVLTGDDLNVLIDEEPELAQLKGKVYLRIEGDELKGQISLPLEEVQPGARVRHAQGPIS